MFFYKNVINGQFVGLTTSPYVLNVKNFYEIGKEEYINLGGYIEPEPVSENSGETGSFLPKSLIDVLVD